MISNKHQNHWLKSGMTLSEVVIATAIIAVCIPLMMAASGGAYRSNLDAEADTRSAWLVRDVQRRIISRWAESSSYAHSEMPFAFPSADSPGSIMELNYKNDGTLLSDDINQATYLVTVEAEAYTPETGNTPVSSLAIVSIIIEYPAKASSNHRKKLTYQYISRRDAIP